MDKIKLKLKAIKYKKNSLYYLSSQFIFWILTFMLVFSNFIFNKIYLLKFF